LGKNRNCAYIYESIDVDENILYKSITISLMSLKLFVINIFACATFNDSN